MKNIGFWFLTAWLFVMGLELNAAPLPLVIHSDVWRYRKGDSAPQTDWKTADDAALDASWASGPGGFGYGDGDDATVLGDMEDGYSTVYIRINFEVPAEADLSEHLVLKVDYDDAFVAWIEGVEVARSTNAPGTAGEEPDYSDHADNNHEASAGGGDAPSYFNLGPASDWVDFGQSTLALMGLNVSDGSSDFSLIADLQLGDSDIPVTSIIEDTTWVAADSPYIFPETVTVEEGATLTIDPGVEVQFGAGRDLVVRGRLLAEGTRDERIRFTRMDGVSSWGRIDFLPNDLEQRLVYVDIEYSGKVGNVRADGARLYLESVEWMEAEDQLLTVDDTALIVKDCVFPGISSQELLHFNGMPEDGYADFIGNWFGPTSQYSDIIDITGGNLPGPIARFIDNVFSYGADDCLDLDGTDALVEGNIFMHVHQDVSRSSSSNAVATGGANGQTTEVVIVRNIFFDCDHALLLKEGATAVMQNNTIVRIRDTAASSQPAAAINFQESNKGTAFGGGALLDGNIIWDLGGNPLTLNFDPEESFLEIRRTIIENLVYPGDGNSDADPMFVRPDGSGDLREAFTLQPGSPAMGTGPNGLDMGALVPSGPTITGEPPALTSQTWARLKVGGPGIVAFRYAINRGPYGEEIPIEDVFEGGLIELNDLSSGSYVVSVQGKDFAGYYHQSAVMSRQWIVDTETEDLDQDGMPNDWEKNNGLNPDDAGDALLDADQDGYSNLDEYRAGTDPRDAGSRLWTDLQQDAELGTMKLVFHAVEGKRYVLQSRGPDAGATWEDLQELGPMMETGPHELALAPVSTADAGFYRVVLQIVP